MSHILGIATFDKLGRGVATPVGETSHVRLLVESN